MTDTSMSEPKASAGNMLKLGLLYWAYFSIFGVLFPYAARFYREHGYSFEQIGIIMALITSANIFAPFMIARLSDLSGRRILLARISLLLLLCAVYFLDPSVSVFYSYLMSSLIGISLSMALPQFEAITLASLGKDKHRYGLVRLWGSIGFLCSVWITGQILSEFGVAWFRYMMIGYVSLVFITTLSLPDRKIEKVKVDQLLGNGLEKLLQPTILAFFVIMMLNQMSLAPYNSFADLYFQQWGYDSLSIGSLFALAPFSEALLMGATPFILHRFGYFPLLIVALALSVVRWLIMAWQVDNLPLLIVAQCIHSFNFGAMHGTAIYLIGMLFVSQQQGMAQSLYVSLVAGLGLVVGNLVTGWLWSDGNGAEFIFVLSALACALSLMLSLLFLKPTQLRAHFNLKD